MHGTHADMTNDFITKAAETKPIAMITEGTRINQPTTTESEQTVYQQSKQQLTKKNTYSIVDFNFKDVDRFTTFYRITKELNKTLVISFKHACFLEQYHKDTKLNTPNSTDDHIMLLKPKRMTGTYITEDYTDNYIKNRLNYSNIITAEELKQHPQDYIIVLNFWFFPTLIDLKPPTGLYIHSLSEPFNEEMQLSYDRMLNWLNHFNLNLQQIHCSGHICGNDLKELIQTINPQHLYPIHTEHPKLFTTLPQKTTMVREGKTYNL